MDLTRMSDHQSKTNDVPTIFFFVATKKHSHPRAHNDNQQKSSITVKLSDHSIHIEIGYQNEYDHSWHMCASVDFPSNVPSMDAADTATSFRLDEDDNVQIRRCRV